MELIVAYDNKRGIGLNGDMPWHVPADLKHFSNITSSNIVIMGRKTWDSLPDEHRPLKNRINYIVSSTMDQDIDIDNKNVFVLKSLDDCLGHIMIRQFNKRKIFIIGGQQLYNEAINHSKLNKIHVTEIYKDFGCDKHFSELPDRFNLSDVSHFKKTKDDIYFRFLTYTLENYDTKWVNNEEMQYINMLQHIFDNGLERSDRTGVGTVSTFGKQFEYNLEDTFPLLTTKRMFVRAIFEELALYISGKTDNGILQEKGIHIWDGNTTRDFLDKRGLVDYKENDMGETYGFNFRHYGAEYKGFSEDYTGQGFDQLSYVIYEIKNNPSSRRLIINLWNAKTMRRAALPACLCMYQFYVDTKNKKLNLQIYIRSSDFFLANNWNTCTGAFLVYMICNLKGIDLEPGKLSVITGDTHIYLSHLEAVQKNLERTPKPFPKLIVKEQKDSIEEFTWEDFKIVGYKPYPNISAPMAV